MKSHVQGSGIRRGK